MADPQQQHMAVPDSDPTDLTREAVDRATDMWRRELTAMRNLLEAQIDKNAARIDGLKESVELAARERADQIHAVRELLESRINGMDRATTLLATEAATYPEQFAAARQQIMTAAREQLQATRDLLESRLDGMDKATKLLADNVSVIGDAIEKSAAGTKQIIETRLAGMDEATKLLATNVDKVPYAILQEAGNLKAFIMSRIDDVSHVSDEKFAAIDGTFASNALALTAALAAQKEAAAEQNKSNTLAITKSEQATKETIAANAAQTSAGLASQSATIADLKDRVVRIEAGGIGAQGQRTETRLNSGQIVSVAGAIFALVAVIVTIFIAARGH